MTREVLEKLFHDECTLYDADGKRRLTKTPDELLNWISHKFAIQDPGPHTSLFSKAFTGMYDKSGKAIHEGNRVKLYYKGTYVICTVIYDPKHAAFFIKWPDGYVNQYFMNGGSYEIVED